jgi:hypothetical protein
MAWEWLPASVTGVVGIAGIIGTAWGGTVDRRHQRAVRRETVARERLEDLYLDILASGRYDLATSRPATIVVGDPPAPRSTDEMLLRQSRINAFASHAMIAAYEAFQAECQAASRWNGHARARAREGYPNEPTHQFPPEAEGLSVADLRSRATAHWEQADSKYGQLVELVRKELAMT